MPEVELADLVVRTTSLNGDRAVLDIMSEMRNHGKQPTKGFTTEYRYYPVRLYTDEVQGNGRVVKSGQMLEGVRPCSAEAPYRYVLVAELKDKK